MDVDVEFFPATIHSQHALAAMEANFHFDDYEEDDDLQVCFPCPFCCMDIEVSILCTHLQEEHCFDIKNAVCPVCAENLGRSMIDHFTVQHAHMLKRRKSRTGRRMNHTAKAGKEHRELNSFFEYRDAPVDFWRRVDDSMPDPLLLPFISGFRTPDAKSTQAPSPVFEMGIMSSSADVKSPKVSKLYRDQEEEQGEGNKEGWLRAEFVRQLFMSTIF